MFNMDISIKKQRLIAKQQLQNKRKEVNEILQRRGLSYDNNEISNIYGTKNIEKIYKNERCCICNGNDESILIIPCRHMVCSECVQFINKCPICDSKIDMNVKIK
jgi:hypothetical protein